ncbi:MAG: SHOCT domain-containing protein [Thermoplasmata archaeon]|nr:SHOCT domain-containing protein [Thermoplasmata archaeon]
MKGETLRTSENRDIEMVIKLKEEIEKTSKVPISMKIEEGLTWKSWSFSKPAELSVVTEKKNTDYKDDDIIIKLEKLKELKDKGILTEEEFNKKKEELLKRI